MKLIASRKKLKQVADACVPKEKHVYAISMPTRGELTETWLHRGQIFAVIIFAVMPSFLFCLIIYVWQNSRAEVSRRTICPSSSLTAGEKFGLQRLWHAAAPHHCRLCKSSLFQLITSNPGTKWYLNLKLFFFFLSYRNLCFVKTYTKVQRTRNCSGVQMYPFMFGPFVSHNAESVDH